MRAIRYPPHLIIVCAIIGAGLCQDKYTDETRPYKFGFNIEGYQHRQEEKDEKGIIKGEYGFITADGYYRVTVYATDENGDFRIISMKNYYVGFPPEDPQTTPQPPQSNRGAPISLPGPASSPVGGKAREQPRQEAAPRGRTPVQQTGLIGCSDCLIPTTKAPDTRQGLRPSSPGSETPGRAGSPFGSRNRGGGGGGSGGGGFGGGGSSGGGFGGGGTGGGFGRGGTGGGGFGGNTGGRLGGEGGVGGDGSGVGGPTGVGRDSVYNTQNPISGRVGSRFGGPSRGAAPGDNAQRNNLVGGGGAAGGGSGGRGTSGGEFGGRGGAPPGAGEGFTGGDRQTGGRPAIGTVRDGLPRGVTTDDIKALLYRFNYTVGFHGHHEDGYRNGDKEGDYFFDGRDGVERKVEYIANEFGYQPNITFIDLPENDVRRPNERTEKEYGLKGYEFKWFYRK